MSDTPAELFPGEALQLTDAVIANLTDLDLSNIDLFSFENYSSTTVARRKRTALANLKCKTYPGDILWPSTFVWKLFDILLGGALIKTIPYAVRQLESHLLGDLRETYEGCTDCPSL